MFSPTSRALSRYFIPLILIVFLAPFVALLFYAVPTTDDFCKATLSFQCVPQQNALRVTWLYYTQWSPRWLTILIQSLLMRHVDLVSGYGWMLLLVMASNLAALWFFFRTIFGFSRYSSVLAAAVFYSAWVASLAHPEEIIFWLTGATEYFLSLSTLLVLLCLLYKPRSSAWYSALVGLLSLAVPAQHEMAGLFLWAVLLTGTIVSRFLKLPARQWYLAFVSASISQFVVMLSRGNSIRAVQEHRHLWDFRHLPKWLAHSFYHGLDWLALPSVLLAACCLFLLMQSSGTSQISGRPWPRWIPLAAIAGMLFVVAEYCLVEMASGSWSPDRVVAWFSFLFCLLFVCVVLTGIPEISRIQFSQATKAGVLLMWAVSLLGSNNFRQALQDLHGPARQWHRIDAEQLKQRGGDINFQLPAKYPKFSMEQEISSDPGCWVNRCLANYLHASTVASPNSTEKCP